MSARAFQRVFTCKNRRRYNRERAPRSLGEKYSILFSRVLSDDAGAQRLRTREDGRFFSAGHAGPAGGRGQVPRAARRGPPAPALEIPLRFGRGEAVGGKRGCGTVNTILLLFVCFFLLFARHAALERTLQCRGQVMQQLEDARAVATGARTRAALLEAP